MTVGVQFSLANVSLEGTDDLFTIQVWDLAGQPQFKDIRGTFYLGSSVAIIVGDLYRPGTFSKIPVWIDEIMRNVEKPIPIIIAANKLDLVSKEDMQKQLSELKESFSSINDQYPNVFDTTNSLLATSAKTGHNLHEVFQLALVKALFFHYKDQI